MTEADPPRTAVPAPARVTFVDAVLALDDAADEGGLPALPSPREVRVWRTADGRHLVAAATQRRYRAVVDAIACGEVGALGAAACEITPAAWSSDGVPGIDTGIGRHRLERVIRELLAVDLGEPDDVLVEMIPRDGAWQPAGNRDSRLTSAQRHLLVMDADDARTVQDRAFALALAAGWIEESGPPVQIAEARSHDPATKTIDDGLAATAGVTTP